jgi:hypothetical protein
VKQLYEYKDEQPISRLIFVSCSKEDDYAIDGATEVRLIIHKQLERIVILV